MLADNGRGKMAGSFLVVPVLQKEKRKFKKMLGGGDDRKKFGSG